MVLEIFNSVCKTSYRSYESFVSNYEHWRKTYTPEQIEQAIRNIPLNSFWADKMEPTILFRRKNPNGENVDWIGSLLNQREKTNSDKHADTVKSASIGYLQKLIAEQS